MLLLSLSLLHAAAAAPPSRGVAAAQSKTVFRAAPLHPPCRARLSDVVMHVNSILCAAAAALLAAIACTIGMAGLPSFPAAPPPPDTKGDAGAFPKPLLCSENLAYEPHLSVSDFAAKYKVARCAALLVSALGDVAHAGPPSRCFRAGG